MKRVIAGLAAAAAAVAIAPAGASAQDDASITLLHGIPGVTVDVAVDGAVVIPGFEPGATQDLSSFAGQTLVNLEVRLAGTEDVAIGPVAEFAVPAAGDWTVIAHLDAEGTPTVTPFENDVTPAADGQGRLTVRHTAAAPAVDIVLGDARPFTGVENGQGGSADLPAGEIAGAQVAPAGGDPIADVPTVNLAAGTNLIVYAVGSLEDGSFTFYTEERAIGTEAPADGGEAGDGTPAPTEVNTGNAIDGGPSVGLLLAAGALALLGAGALVFRRNAA